MLAIPHLPNTRRVTVERHFVTLLNGAPATEWRVVVEGYGISASYASQERAEYYALGLAVGQAIEALAERAGV